MPLFDSRAGPSYGATDQQVNDIDEERDQLLQDEYEIEGESSGSSTSTTGDVQEGVRKIEAISMTWTTRSLIVAYVRCVVAGNIPISISR